MGERSKAVVLDLEEPVPMVEALREPQERHGPEGRSRAQADAGLRCAWGQAPLKRIRTDGRLQLNRDRAKTAGLSATRSPDARAKEPKRVGLMIPATRSLVSAPKTDCLKCPDVGTGHKVRVLTYCVAMSSHVLISDCRTAALVAVLSGASLSFTTCPVAAQQPVPQQLVASLRVVDKKGAPFTDLALNEFDVKENGQSRTIIRAELDTRPLSVALVLDSNGTLSTAFMQNVVPAAVAVLNALPQGTVLDVWSTGDRPTHLVTAQSDRPAVEAAVKRIAASGTNMLLDTIAAASQALPSGEDRRTAVIVLTSGSIGDNAGRGVQEALNATSMRPTFVSIEMILGERDGRVGTGLTYLAEHTAGSYETVLSATAVVTKAPGLVAILNSRYRVAWQPQSDPRATKFEFKTNRKGAKVVWSQQLTTAW